MALVDYSSSSSGDGDDPIPSPAKRHKGRVETVEPGQAGGGADRPKGGSGAEKERNVTPSKKTSDSDMPPLPEAFHDLYASTVRQSVVDDPSLHQGRKRLTPHVVGNWPSHLYVEWHPTTSQHDKLVELLDEIQEELHDDVELHRLLTSDLGAPLPLHISLSRPLSLPTAEKDVFLEKVSGAIQNSGLGEFIVLPQGLAWYRSPDSERTFLILRVSSNGSVSDHKKNPNPELMGLLTRCNTTAALFKQPVLYQRNQSDPVGNAFHVSIAWTFDLPNDELSLKTLKLFKQKRFADIRSWEIGVSGVKAKIGNVVNHIPLKEHRQIGSLSTGSGPFFT